MNFTIVATVFPLILLGELPDKTMFACVFLASNRRASAVWLGAATGFAVQVVLGVLVGVALFHLLPHLVLEAIVGVAFLAGGIYSFLLRNSGAKSNEVVEVSSPSRLGTLATAAVVVFLAEWGDVTQILTVSLAARYHSPLSVGVGALAALWTVAFLAVTAASYLPRAVSPRSLRLAAAALLTAIAGYTFAGML